MYINVILNSFHLYQYSCSSLSCSSGKQVRQVKNDDLEWPWFRPFSQLASGDWDGGGWVLIHYLCKNQLKITLWRILFENSGPCKTLRALSNFSMYILRQKVHLFSALDPHIYIQHRAWVVIKWTGVTRMIFLVNFFYVMATMHQDFITGW